MIIFHHDPCCVLDQPVYGKVKIGQGQEFVHQSNQKLYTVYFGEEVLIGDSILDKGKRSTITRIKEEQGTDGALLRTFTCHG